MFLSVAEAGVLCLVLFALFGWLGIFAKTRAVLALLAAASIGIGFIGRLFHTLGTWLSHASGSVTAWAFGVSVPTLAFIVLAVILIHDLHPRKGATARTGWIALLTGMLLAAGVAGLPSAALASDLHSAVSGATSFINSL